MNNRLKKLIRIARYRMQLSNDPIHEVMHARRVVVNGLKIAGDIGLDLRQKNIIILASWWHDVARSITKKPSFVWMFLIDDPMSAIMLTHEAWRKGLLSDDMVKTAIKIIICKSISASKLLPRVLLKVEDRLLVDIVNDADNLDVINIERIKIIQTLAEQSKLYSVGYKLTINWYLKSKQLLMKTKEAKDYARELIIQFITWIKQRSVIVWHMNNFGERWVKRKLQKFDELLKKLSVKQKENDFIYARN